MGCLPDLPGCFSTGDTMEETVENVYQSVAQHVEIMIADGEAIPADRPLAVHKSDPDYAGWVLAIVDVAVDKHLRPTEKISAIIASGVS